MAKLTPLQLRALFPATTRAAYLNAAASSPLALPVEKAVSEHYRETVDWGDIGFESWLRRREDVRRDLARLIGAQPKDTAFVANTSTGMLTVALFLKRRGIREIVTLEGEFPTSTIPFLNQGFTLRVVRRRADGTYSPEDIEAAVGKRTGALVASAVQFSSGFRLDLTAAKKVCRSRKLLLVVNAAQAIGQIPLDVEAQGIDFLCATSHKWLMGGYGVGLFYARAALLEKDDLPVAGWLSVERPLQMDNVVGAKLRGAKRNPYFEARGVRVRKEGSALEIGSTAFGTIFGVGEALKLHQQVGVRTTEAHNRALQKVLRRRLREAGFEPNVPDDPTRVAGISVFGVKGDARTAVRELGKKGVVVSARGGGIRVSTHVFNTLEDVDQLFWALEKASVRPAGATG